MYVVVTSLSLCNSLRAATTVVEEMSKQAVEKTAHKRDFFSLCK